MIRFTFLKRLKALFCPKAGTDLDFDEQITPTLRLRITRHVSGREPRAKVPGTVVFRSAAGPNVAGYEYLITVYVAPIVPAPSDEKASRLEAKIEVFETKMGEFEARTTVAAENTKAAHKAATDAVSAAWVRDAIAEGNAKALEADRAMAKVQTTTITPLTPSPDKGPKWGLVVPPTAHPDYAEIIRLADALYRLAGVK